MINRKVLEVSSAVTLLSMWAIAVYYWPTLPELVPTHFDFSGKPDDWRTKQWLFFIPALSVLIYLLLTIISRFPNKFNFPVEITDENRGAQYKLALFVLSLVKLEMLLSFAYITWIQIQVALERANGSGFLFIVIFIPAIFGTIAWHFRKAKQLV